MGIEYYLFAAFVFGLVLVLVLLILKGLSKNKTKRETERDQKEEKVLMLYSDVEDFLKGVEEYMEAGKKEIRMERERVEQLIVEFSKTQNRMQANVNEQYEQAEQEEKEQPVVLSTEKMKLREEVWRLAENGYSVGDIAERTNAAQNEIVLILSLNNKNTKV